MDNEKKILKILKQKKEVTSSKIASDLGVSRQYASRLLNGLADQQKILRAGKGRYTKYIDRNFALNHSEEYKNIFSQSFKVKGLREHEVADEAKGKILNLSNIEENVVSIFDYSFSEMVNNAVDHSQSKTVAVTVQLTKDHLWFDVIDSGVGVFRNVMNKKSLDSELEAIQDLLKGKLTTMPHMHSGEGIFFTSRAADIFTLSSYGYIMKRDNLVDDIFIGQDNNEVEGTKASFVISRNSSRHLGEIFKQYTNQFDGGDFGFDKTEIQVKLYTIGGVHVSRSQAKRVLHGLETFDVIIMDYDKVPMIGQAFADEIYRVYQNKYPKKLFKNINMNEAVEFMINRTITEAKRKK